jgi:hypothetical protein
VIDKEGMERVRQEQERRRREAELWTALHGEDWRGPCGVFEGYGDCEYAVGDKS